MNYSLGNLREYMMHLAIKEHPWRNVFNLPPGFCSVGFVTIRNIFLSVWFCGHFLEFTCENSSRFSEVSSTMCEFFTGAVERPRATLSDSITPFPFSSALVSPAPEGNIWTSSCWTLHVWNLRWTTAPRLVRGVKVRQCKTLSSKRPNSDEEEK